MKISNSVFLVRGKLRIKKSFTFDRRHLSISSYDKHTDPDWMSGPRCLRHKSSTHSWPETLCNTQLESNIKSKYKKLTFFKVLIDFLSN